VKQSPGGAICQSFMKLRPEDQTDDKAIDIAATLAKFGVELQNTDYLDRAISWYEALEKRSIRDERRIFLDYTWANAIAGLRYGTEWQWEQATLSREIYLLRRAISHSQFSRISHIERCQTLNNLGNRLIVAGRTIEALACWRRTLELQPQFGMALGNRARTLWLYASALEDLDHKVLFFWAAHEQATAALAPTAIYTHPSDQKMVQVISELKRKIEEIVDIKRIEKEDLFAWPDTSTTEQERNYRRWCLLHYQPAERSWPPFDRHD
jgi:tetratricopeptide (TPR) repeat protein